MKLEVIWIPQVPMKGFRVPVANLVEARLILDTLAEYDAFQCENNVKGDYCNAGGLLVFDENDTEDSPEGSWVDWHDNEGRSIDDFTLEELRTLRSPRC